MSHHHVHSGFYVDHAENCDKLEEDSVDRLWLVVRSLKNLSGKYVSLHFSLNSLNVFG